MQVIPEPMDLWFRVRRFASLLEHVGWRCSDDG
jgi:hypothetical protein